MDFEKTIQLLLRLFTITNKIASAIDRKELTAGVLLDLSKAFDTLDHEILLNKLEHYVIRGMALHWIENYLSSRTKQFVQYRKTCSDEQIIKCGVPQGNCEKLMLGCESNTLSVNIKKTNYVIFKSKQKRINANFKHNIYFTKTRRASSH